MGGCIVDASAVQGTAFLTNKTKASSLAQALSTLVATRARSIEASDCGLESVEVPSILTCGTLTDLVQQTASMLTGCWTVGLQGTESWTTMISDVGDQSR